MRLSELKREATVGASHDGLAITELPVGVRAASAALRWGRGKLPSRLVDGITFHVNTAIASRVEHRYVNVKLLSGVSAALPLSDYAMRRIALLGEYEPELQAFAERVVAPGDLVVDIGANFGRHTLPLARLTGPRGRVVAFEPAPRAFAFLSRSVTLNGFEDQVSMVPAAVGADVGTATLWLDDGIGLMNSLRDDWVGSTQMVQVDVVTLDSALEAYADMPMGLLKIDAEGFGANILQGGHRVLKARRPLAVILEVSSRERPEELLATMNEYGYERVQIRSGEIERESRRLLPAENDDRPGKPGFAYDNLYLMRADGISRAATAAS